MKLVIIVCSLVLLILLIAKKPIHQRFLKVYHSFCFVLAFSFFLLFGVHLLLGFFGFFVPINLFTGTVTSSIRYAWSSVGISHFYICIKKFLEMC